MADDETVQGEHCCCHTSALNKRAERCRGCGREGMPVKDITIKSFVKPSKLSDIVDLGGFYFCATPECGVVYFNNNPDIYVYKGDIKVRVGIKESEDPIPVCYCFNWTKDMILDQIKNTGTSTVVEEITARVRSGECQCEIKNPSGRCCLGEVKRVVEDGLEIYGGGGG